MSLTVITTPLAAATPPFAGGSVYDLVSLADLKLELQISDNSQDTWLRKIIARASRAIGNYCSRNFAPQLYQELLWSERDAFPWQVPGGAAPLQLRHWPLITPQAQVPQPPLAGTAPPLLPVLSSIVGGSLARRRYFVRTSYMTPQGETAASLEATLLVAASSLLQVTSPAPDNFGIATGWNVYVGAASYQETLQSAAPIAIGASWTEPAPGLLSPQLAAPPSSVLAVVDVLPTVPAAVSVMASLPQPLAEGVDFDVDAQHGQLTRLFALSGEPDRWATLPTAIVYQAGYASIPDDLTEAAILLAKARYFGRLRDPMIRQEDASGIYSATYWMGTGPGGVGDLPDEVMSKIDRHKVPVTA